MSVVYGWVVLVAVLVSLKIWGKTIEQDRQLLIIYLLALFGALCGAHLGYFFAEGSLINSPRTTWISLFSGKTILGGLIGGFLTVEVTKIVIGYKEITGDLFALSVPLAIAVARIGCLDAGCCPGKVCPVTWYSMVDSHGVNRWPAVPVEIAFNLLAAAIFLLLRSRSLYLGQHFHIYMIGYGLFRFMHEYMRDTPLLGTQLSGYQFLSIFLVLLGLTGLIRRELAFDNARRTS